MEIPRFELETMTNQERDAIEALEAWRRSGGLREFQALQKAADQLLESKKRWHPVAGRWDTIRDRLTGARIVVHVKDGGEDAKRKAVAEVLDQLNAQEVAV